MEKAELSAIEQSTKENFEKLQQDKIAMERDLQDKSEMERKELLREIEDLKNKSVQSESAIAESQRKVFET